MNKKGFTLIELLTAIAILGILVLLAAPKFLGYTEQAKLAQIKNDVKAYETQLSSDLIEDPSYLDLNDYDGLDICRINYGQYLEGMSLRDTITGKDLMEISIFPEIAEHTYSKEEVIDLLKERAESENHKIYTKKGAITSLEEIEKLIDDGNMYHVLPRDVVKSHLRGAFLASQNGDVIYVNDTSTFWGECHM